MRKIKVLFSAIAVVFALAGVMATHLPVANEPGYEFIDNPGSVPDECVQRLDDCNTTGSYACKVTQNSPTLRRIVSDTQCGIELKRNTPPSM